MSARAGLSCFITGAGGFVGQHCVRAALDAGFHVTALLHRTAGASDAEQEARLFRQRRRLLSCPGSIRRLTFVEGCLANEASVRDVFERRAFHAVVHLAGVTRIARAEHDATRARLVNVEGTKTLARMANESASRCGRATHFVFASTVRVFDGLPSEPMDARAAKAPTTAYAHSKLLAEDGLQSLPALEVLVQYIPNFFGCGESATVIPIWLGNALAGRPIPIWGDGTAQVAFTRVEPYCQRLFQRLLREPRHGAFERVLEWAEHRVSLRGLAEVICDVLDASEDPRSSEMRERLGTFRALIRHEHHENV